MAGLVGGDSDSSALTQESGDEGVAEGAAKEGWATGTEGGSEMEVDEDETREQSGGALLLACSGLRFLYNDGMLQCRSVSGETKEGCACYKRRRGQVPEVNTCCV